MWLMVWLVNWVEVVGWGGFGWMVFGAVGWYVGRWMVCGAVKLVGVGMCELRWWVRGWLLPLSLAGGQIDITDNILS